MNNLTIRPESSDDFAPIYALIQTAFETAAVKDGDEQDYAVGLRQGEDYMPDLALVAEIDGKLAGHIMLTRINVERSDGSLFGALLLSPLSVLLQYRNMGIGSALIKESFRRAFEDDFCAVFVVGDPLYYSKSGFVPASQFGIVSKSGIPEKYVQAIELTPGALAGASGVIDCI